MVTFGRWTSCPQRWEVRLASPVATSPTWVWKPACCAGRLLASVTKERPSRGRTATKQTYKVDRSASVAVSLPWAGNHGVCHRGRLCGLWTICRFKAVGAEGGSGGGREGVVSLSFCDSRLTSKGPADDIRPAFLSAYMWSSGPFELRQVGTSHLWAFKTPKR